MGICNTARKTQIIEKVSRIEFGTRNTIPREQSPTSGDVDLIIDADGIKAGSPGSRSASELDCARVK